MTSSLLHDCIYITFVSFCQPPAKTDGDPWATAVHIGGTPADIKRSATLPTPLESEKTVVLGIVSVNNPADAVPGLAGENDEQFRIRRNKSLANPSFSTIGGLYAKLANLDGVTDLQVYENYTDSFDPAIPVTLVMPPHSIWVVIEGGTEGDIAETMAKQKTDGCNMKGSSIGTWVETVTRPNGTQFTITHRMKFDRPTIVTLYVRLTVTRKIPTQPIDTALIKKFLIKKEYMIGEAAQANELYGYAYQAGTNFIATDLEISIDGITWTSGQIATDYADELTITEGSITIAGT